MNWKRIEKMWSTMHQYRRMVKLFLLFIVFPCVIYCLGATWIDITGWTDKGEPLDDFGLFFVGIGVVIVLSIIVVLIKGIINYIKRGSPWNA